jgi:protein TonB
VAEQDKEPTKVGSTSAGVIDFDIPSLGSSWPVVAVASVFVTAAIFMLIPFTQLLESIGRDDSLTVSVDIAPPPPPPPPDPPEDEEEELEDPPPPPPPPPPPQLSLSQLDLALEPGIGDAMAGAFGMGGFATAPDAVEEMKDFFSLSELDENPRRISGITPQAPFSLRRDRIKAYTQALVEIDEQGNVRVISFAKTTHRSMEEEFLKVVDTFKYTAPTKDGRKVKARFYIPFAFDP